MLVVASHASHRFNSVFHSCTHESKIELFHRGGGIPMSVTGSTGTHRLISVSSQERIIASVKKSTGAPTPEPEPTWHARKLMW